MPITAVLFDLDDTLLWDERSVEEAFRNACEAAGDSIDPKELEVAVRREARNLYETYETFPFTKMIGINPYEALWSNFSAGEQPEFRKLQQLAPVYRKESWRRGLASSVSKMRCLPKRWQTGLLPSAVACLTCMKRRYRCLMRSVVK